MTKKFTIKRGRHTSSPLLFLERFIPTFCKSFHFTVEFNKGCIYHLEGEDTYDINKLFGVGNGLNHHKNSVRLGWRCVDNEHIELVSYIYINGVRQAETVMLQVKPEEKVKCQIMFIDKQVIITTTSINGTNNLVINIAKKQFVGFLLWPFFGGNQVAPHEMKINLSFQHIF